MQNATNISAKVLSYFNNLNSRVVQKGNIGGYYAYALQLMYKHTYVYRARNGLRVKFDPKKPILDLAQTAAGHTQTWEYSGKKNCWFVGTKYSDASGWHWDKQIARVKIPDSKTHTHNYNFPRLSWIPWAGGMYDANDSNGMNDNTFVRSEAAVSPEYNTFLLVTVDKNGNGYFTLYDLDKINKALDGNYEGEATVVKLKDFDYLKSFKLPKLVGSVGSLQGFDIDEDNNIYISSEKAPSGGSQKPRKIVKIPWGSTNPNEWQYVDLDHVDLDRVHMNTELEGIQIVGNNHAYLTVSYHPTNKKGTDYRHRIYDVTWD